MRSVIVNTARDRNREKRGAGEGPITLRTEISEQVTDGDEDVLRIHEALASLEHADARLAELVEMRYFGGYSEQEIADTLGVTVRTVQRQWEKARALLYRTMKAD